MSEDSLKGLIANVPDWLRRLDQLSDQIDQRQLDLARFDERKSLLKAQSHRRKGSTESLRPNDDDPEPRPREDAARANTPPASPPAEPQPASALPEISPASDLPEALQQPLPASQAKPPSSPNSEPRSAQSNSLRQKKEVVITAQRRVRAVVRKRQKTESMLSGEGGVATYRSRNMVIVYYDSYVQSFFEELVKFVSASRNLMRKAKMAAKVAQIKKMAALDMPEEEDDDRPFQPVPEAIAVKRDGEPSSSLLQVAPDNGSRYPGAHQMGLLPRSAPPASLQVRPSRSTMFGPSGLSGFGPKNDVYDDLDKALEYVQGMCERAAHQFLRDGDFSEEVEKIKDRLSKTKDLADKEMQQIRQDAPASEDSESQKSRKYRPTSMRREPSASSPAISSATKTSDFFFQVDAQGSEDGKLVPAK